MPLEPANDFWPAPLRHCANPLVNPADEYVTIGEISSNEINGYRGNRLFYTALVPFDKVEPLLKAVGGIGHGIFSESRHPNPNPEEISSRTFGFRAQLGQKDFSHLCILGIITIRLSFYRTMPYSNIFN